MNITLLSVVAASDDPSSGFWTGTGSAIVGAGLSGIVAVGAAFLAAWLARRHDRRQEARQAAARIDAAAYDVWHDLLVISDQDDYPTLVGYRMFELRRAVVRETAYLTDAALIMQLRQITAWLHDAWLPEVKRTVDELPSPGPDEDIDPRVDALAVAGGEVVSEMNTTVQVWLATEKVYELDPFPDLDNLPSEVEEQEPSSGN